jgi:hypothetical protein
MASEAAEKGAVVIPNPRPLRVRDLQFASTLGKKQMPHPVKTERGSERHVFEFFPQRPQPCLNGW